MTDMKKAVPWLLAAGIVFVGFLAIDSYLSRPEVVDRRIANARALGVNFSPHRPIDVIAGNNLGQVLQVTPEDFNSPDLYPLSNPALSPVILCNESGQWVVIETDELGFNNPRGQWDKATDLMLIGDSYTEGWCVPQGRAFADHIRAAFPLTINLGRAGRGPLSELAMLIEYTPALRPKRIVWFFHDNDFGNLAAEQTIPILLRYFGEFSQHLYERREIVNREVREFMDDALARLLPRRGLPFYGTRHLINGVIRSFRASVTEPSQPNMVGLFRNVMARAKEVAEVWGAELTFVYLRDYRTQEFEAQREKILNVVAVLGIPVYDIGADITNGRQLHRLTADHPVTAVGNMRRHYNRMGHKVVGRLVVEWLRR